MSHSAAARTTVPSPPTATYRLQLQPDFPFAAAEAVVPHLASLGVSHIHLSPVLQAVPGSTHGYDVVDHTRVRDELGGEAGLRALSATARAHGLGLVLDVVPNHMAVPVPEYLAQPLWAVLRDGPRSPYARWFDIDWDAQGGKVLLPVLGGPIEEVLGRAELRLTQDAAAGELVLRYYDHAFPLRPGTERLPLDQLVQAQWYRLACWRQASTEINYRRFFTISDLIGVRVEEQEVFEATHATLLRLLRDGVADGLRIDHPDGLADPAGYLRRLREASGGRWTVVEKILTGDEPLPGDWACAGTTGYDALDRVDGLFTDPEGVERVAAFYREFTGAPADRGGEWDATARRAAYRLITRDLAAEVDRLARAASQVRPGTDPEALRTALREVLVRFPVYRPYVVPGEPAPDSAVEMLTEAAEGACRAAPAEAVDLVRDLALGRLGRGPGQDDFAVRFAQVSSALRAKSIEDTAFYRWYPLLSSNEVGREPDHTAVPPAVFHDFCARLQRDWPATGTVLSTHDTKRSADVRARLAALSEVPKVWREWLPDASRNLHRLCEQQGIQVPGPHVEYQAWQYAVAFGGNYEAADRVAATLLKSEREAGLRTSWTEQGKAYEERLEAFAREMIGGPSLYALGDIVRATHGATRAHMLGATLVQLTMPGVPDVYQGDEIEQLLLVDPDNRTPYAPFHPRPGLSASGPAEILERIDRSWSEPGLEHFRSHNEKLLVTAVALRLRRDHPDWFGPGATYEPLHADGAAAEHCVAFVRTGRAITVATRLARRLEEAGGWRDTVLALPDGDWTDLLTRRTVSGKARLSELLDTLPVALLAPAEA